MGSLGWGRPGACLSAHSLPHFVLLSRFPETAAEAGTSSSPPGSRGVEQTGVLLPTKGCGRSLHPDAQLGRASGHRAGRFQGEGAAPRGTRSMRACAGWQGQGHECPRAGEGSSTRLQVTGAQGLLSVHGRGTGARACEDSVTPQGWAGGQQEPKGRPWGAGAWVSPSARCPWCSAQS